MQYFLAYLGSVVKIESKFEPPPPIKNFWTRPLPLITTLKQRADNQLDLKRDTRDRHQETGKAT